MALTHEELAALVRQKIQEKEKAIVEALLQFNRNPNAQTFKDAENIPDRLMGQALDDIVAEVLQRTTPEVSLEEPTKKNSALKEKDGHPYS